MRFKTLNILKEMIIKINIFILYNECNLFAKATLYHLLPHNFKVLAL